MKSGYNGEVTTSKKFAFLQRMDMFGVGININYNKETKFRTRFGGFITLIVVLLLAILIFSSLQQIIYKTNPKILFEQKIVLNPSRYDLNKKNFSIAIALFQTQQKVLYDETVFRIEAIFSYKERPVNSDGSLGTAVIKQKPIELEKCNQNSFQVDDTQDYFLSLAYQNMYCMKNYDDLFLVGQYEMDDYSYIQFKVIPCSSKDPKNKVQCMDTQKQNDILKKTSLQIFFNNRIVQVSSYEQPFKSTQSTQFWKTNIDFQQTINLLYMNTFVQDDEGLFFKDIKTTKNLMFSSDRTMFGSIDDLAIFKIGIFLEKNKEQYYTRQYLKIQNIISEIGGIYNVLLLIGILIAQPYSKMQLHRNLFNQTFSITMKQQNQNNKNLEDNNNSDGKAERSQENQQSQLNNDKSDFLKSPKLVQSQQIEIKQGQIEIQKLKQSDSIEKNPIQQKRSERITAFSKYAEPDIKDKIKNTLTQLTIKTSEIISYYFNCFKILKSDMIEMLDFGSQHIKNFTDICFIVNKLLEVEKLKHVLLNEEQIKLFEFIPKPKIDQEILQMNQLQILNEQKKQFAQKLQNKYKINQTEQQENEQQIQKPFNLLSMKNQPIQIKAKQAQSAFNKIYKNQQKRSKIDLKLVQMLDEKLIKLLNSSAFDELSPKKKRLSAEKVSPAGQNLNNDYNRINKNMNLKILSKEISIISPKIFSSILDVKQTEFNDVDDHDVHETCEGLKLYEQRPKQLMQSAETRNRILSFQQSDFLNIDNSQNQDEIKQQQSKVLDPVSEKYIQELFQV